MAWLSNQKEKVCVRVHDPGNVFFLSVNVFVHIPLTQSCVSHVENSNMEDIIIALQGLTV